MTQQEAELAIQSSYCMVISCNELATHLDPTSFCQKHFDEWELEDAQWQVESAAQRLAEVKKRQPRKMKIGNDMTERIKDYYERLKR